MTALERVARAALRVTIEDRGHGHNGGRYRVSVLWLDGARTILYEDFLADALDVLAADADR